MKIAIATAVYHPMVNGVAVFSRHLAAGLAKRGHEVMVLCPSQTGKPHILDIDGVKIVYLKSTQIKLYPDQIHEVTPKKKFLGREWPRFFYRHGFWVALTPGAEVRAALNKFQPDVVHSQVVDPIGRAAVKYARKHQIPVVSSEHNQPEVLVESLKLAKFIKKPLENWLAGYFVKQQKKSDFVTMPTKKAILDLIYAREQGFPVPVAAVSNGVDLKNFKPGKPPKAFYSKYHLPSGALVALYVGRLDPEKRVDLVLEAFSQAVKNGLTAELLIAGDGVAKAALEKKALEIGISKHTHFVGRVTPPELYQIYQAGDVFVTASEIETQGIVLIEAAATGLPLIAVDKGAVSEVCRDAQNGFLCHPGEVAEISVAITKILKNPTLRQKFSQKSLEIAREHDFDRTLDQFINIYHKVRENARAARKTK